MPPDASRPRWRLSSRLVLVAFVAIGAFFLIAEHKAHLAGWLPLLLLLACPFMHLMHGGHGDGGHSHGGQGYGGHRGDEGGGQPR